MEFFRLGITYKAKALCYLRSRQAELEPGLFGKQLQELGQLLLRRRRKRQAQLESPPNGPVEQF
jgi:hypothetical protein